MYWTQIWRSDSPGNTFPPKLANAVRQWDKLIEKHLRQAELYRHHGLRPKLEVKTVSARLLYSLVTFKELEPDYNRWASLHWIHVHSTASSSLHPLDLLVAHILPPPPQLAGAHERDAAPPPRPHHRRPPLLFPVRPNSSYTYTYIHTYIHIYIYILCIYTSSPASTQF